MAQAIYFHASVYRFEEDAQLNVVEQFNSEIERQRATLGTGQTRCRYDSDLEGFEMRCPGAFGVQANEILDQIIKKSIASEAHDEEELKFQPKRFPESLSADLANIVEDTTSVTTSPPQLLNGDNVLQEHVIRSHAQAVQLFHMHKLDDKYLLQRTLLPCTSHAEKIVTDGYTCRAVRHIKNEQRYVFNGRTKGVMAEQALNDARGHFECPGFTALACLQENLQDSVLTTTQAGHDQFPEVAQWLDNIVPGQTNTEVVPEEVPRDAKRLLLGSEFTGRVRLPKGSTTVEMLPGKSLEQPTVSSLKESGDAFSSLFASARDEPVLDKRDQDARLPVVNAIESGPKQDVTCFADLLASQADPGPTSPARSTSNARTIEGYKLKLADKSVASSRMKVTMPASTSLQPSLLSSEATDRTHVNHENGLKSYGKRFAVMSKEGLTADPVSTAEWEHKHPSIQEPRIKNRPVVMRTEQASTGALASSHTESDRSPAQSAMRSRPQAEKGTAPMLLSSAFSKLVKKAHQMQSRDTVIEHACSESDDTGSTDVGLNIDNFKHRIVAEVGILFTRVNTKESQDLKNVLTGVFSPPEKLERALANKNHKTFTEFLRRVTTSTKDADYVAFVRPDGFPKTRSKAFYELHLQTNEHDLVVTFDPCDPQRRGSLTKSPICQGKLWLHYADHVWDAQIQLLSEIACSQDFRALQLHIQELLMSLATFNSVPSVKGTYSRSHFDLKKIFAKRTVTFEEDGVSYNVTEVRDLLLTEEDQRFTADCPSLQQMIDEQRAWFEVSFETANLEKLHVIHEYVEDLISKLDGVGMGNQGPWKVSPGH